LHECRPLSLGILCRERREIRENDATALAQQHQLAELIVVRLVHQDVVQAVDHEVPVSGAWHLTGSV
jgi:hypothetical protein